MWEFRCLLICCIPLAFAVNNQVLHLRNGCHRTPPSLFIILYSDIWHVGWHPAIAAANDVYRTDVRRERERARAPTSENVNFLLLWTPFFFSLVKVASYLSSETMVELLTLTECCFPRPNKKKSSDFAGGRPYDRYLTWQSCCPFEVSRRFRLVDYN